MIIIFIVSSQHFHQIVAGCCKFVQTGSGVCVCYGRNDKKHCDCFAIDIITIVLVDVITMIAKTFILGYHFINLIALHFVTANGPVDMFTGTKFDAAECRERVIRNKV